MTDNPTLIDTLISSHANGLTINFSTSGWQGRGVQRRGHSIELPPFTLIT
nr:hypothetical protein JVH1_3433 [Rhodococcus sp. JVH1]